MFPPPPERFYGYFLRPLVRSLVEESPFFAVGYGPTSLIWRWAFSPFGVLGEGG